MRKFSQPRATCAKAIFASLLLFVAGAISQYGAGWAQEKSPAPPAAEKGAATSGPDKSSVSPAQDKNAASPSSQKGAGNAPADKSGASPPSDKSAANAFNRLLRAPTTARNSPPSEDGVHDPQNAGTGLLQWPSEAFTGFAKSSDGNQVDWVTTLKEGKIAPWFEFETKSTEPFLFDLVIVREVKGSMPNVVFPHEAHTQWLDCSNCHDEIFLPQKGANEISMAAILLGQKCGVCHGRVAFPVTDCRRCHAQPKTADELRALAEKSNWAKASATTNKDAAARGTPAAAPSKDAPAADATAKDTTTKK